LGSWIKRKIGIYGGVLWKRKIAPVKGKSVRGMEIVKLAKPFMLILSGNFHASVKLKPRDKFRFVYETL